MPSHCVFGTIVVGVLLVASCGRADLGPSPPARSAPRSVNAPAAAEVADRDNDGVPDDADRCPDDPEDCDGFEDADGCPDDDNDHDFVPDRCDRCPDIAGRRQDGCPFVILDVQTIKIPLVASFEINGVKPSIEADLLGRIVELTKQDRLRRLGIVGHALATEKDAARLATRRAEAVKAVLVGRGVPATKLELRASRVGDVDECPAPGDGGPPPPCVSFALVESESNHMTWDGSRYVVEEPPRPSTPPPECPPAPRAPGHPCAKP